MCRRHLQYRGLLDTISDHCKTHKTNWKKWSRKCWSCPGHPAIFQYIQPSPTWMRLVFALWQIIRVGGSKPWLDTWQACPNSAVTLLSLYIYSIYSLYVYAVVSIVFNQLLSFDQRPTRYTPVWWDAPETIELLDSNRSDNATAATKNSHLITTGPIMSSRTAESSPQSPSSCAVAYAILVTFGSLGLLYLRCDSSLFPSRL